MLESIMTGGMESDHTLWFESCSSRMHGMLLDQLLTLSRQEWSSLRRQRLPTTCPNTRLGHSTLTPFFTTIIASKVIHTRS